MLSHSTRIFLNTNRTKQMQKILFERENFPSSLCGCMCENEKMLSKDFDERKYLLCTQVKWKLFLRIIINENNYFWSFLRFNVYGNIHNFLWISRKKVTFTFIKLCPFLTNPYHIYSRQVL
jgi:hypothetical protein